MASGESTSASPSASSSAASAGDSYIGSLISLTSKSEIRYEGVLVSISPQESTIALQNVRSYGTEGRKKDGLQVPSSDKVYDYILFRGSDIKDLQVKSSSPVHTNSQLNNDPAIIQSHYAYPHTTHSTSASVGDGTLTGLSSHATHPAVARSPVPNAFAMYQAGAHHGSLASSSVPVNNNMSSLSTSMYGQGYVGALSNQAHGQQHISPFQTHPIILPNQLQFSEVHAPSSMPNLPQLATPLTFSSTAPPSHFATSNPADLSLSSSSNSSMLQNPSSLPSHLPTKPSFAPSNQELDTTNPTSGKAAPSPRAFLPAASLPFSSSSILGSASGPFSTLPPLLTPDQLTKSIQTTTSSLQKMYREPKDTGASLPSSTNPPSLPQEPLLPLPRPSRQGQQGTTFTEEFDFTAMNEKFNKDEVWGSLGKAKQIDTARDVTEDDQNHDNVDVEEGYVQDQRSGSKPVYNKDDFFDTLSCNSLNRGGWSGRTKFSERMKLDTETFGEFQQRLPQGRANRGAPHGGNFRGSYSRGRGYGYYGGRGHGGYRLT